jgi:hypothetical protein
MLAIARLFRERRFVATIRTRYNALIRLPRRTQFPSLAAFA